VSGTSGAAAEGEANAVAGAAPGSPPRPTTAGSGPGPRRPHLELLLDGPGWEVAGFLGSGTWEWGVRSRLPSGRPPWAPARVPGSVTDDLWRAGEIESPYFERNSLGAEWVPQRAWVYRRWLQTPRLEPGEAATLVFDGVDHEAGVFIDGAPVGEHAGVFSPFRLDVSAALATGGRHLLAVVVHPAPDCEPQGGDTARVVVHKSRMGYGWDFCPRLVHIGIWRSVTLHIGAPPFLPGPHVATSGDLASGTVQVEGAEEVRLEHHGQLVGREEGPSLSLARPRLWWPNGSGPQERYTLRVTGQGQERRFMVGFRHLEMVPNPGAPEGARPYTVAVNGQRLFLRGWNWVPVDALYGVPRPAKLGHLLTLAAAAGVNCLRVWGGGLLETPEFYRLCDELGLLVWQEFALSGSIGGSVPSADPSFLSALAQEARAVVAERRHHPSLALWCGGNELAHRAVGRDDVPLDETTPVLGALATAVEASSPGAPFLPTSPSGPRFLNRLDIIAADPDGQHDVHGPWEHQGLTDHNVLYDAGTCLLHTEVGVEGMTNRRALERLVGPEHRWPADRTNPVYEHLGAWWDNAALVQACFGGRLSGVDQLRRASQHLQHDGLRYIVESRLRKRPRTSGVFPWQFNEPFPNAWCTAVVDYYGSPKPAYYGVKRAYRAHHVCAAFPTWAWAGGAELSAEVYAWPSPDAVTARLVDMTGKVLAGTDYRPLEVTPAAATRQLPVGTLHAPLGAGAPALVLLDVAARTPGGHVATNRYLLSTGPDLSSVLDVAPAALEVRPVAGGLQLSHGAGPAALGVVIEDDRGPSAEGWPLFGDNVFDLLPGETVHVRVDWRDAPVAGRRLRVEGWNCGPVWAP
jgi:beta-mannosidase